VLHGGAKFIEVTWGEKRVYQASETCHFLGGNTRDVPEL
jgi:hypothetical protein